MSAHETMIEEVAVYALGSLPPQEAERVRAHLRTCAECRREYAELRPAAEALAYAAQACSDPEQGAVVARPQMKARIMQRVRAEAAGPARVNVGEMRAVRPIVWPAYAVAAVCLAIALVTGIIDLSLNDQLRHDSADLTAVSAHNRLLARDLANQRSALTDLVSSDSVRYAVSDGQVVRHGKRLYLAMDALPEPPKGKVYQAWTLRTGSARMSPSVTFVPNANGVAIVAIPVDASTVSGVAVSVEPEGGSKQPTSTPTFVLKLF